MLTFKKAGISKEDQQNAVEDTDDPFAKLAETFNELKVLDPDVVPERITADILMTPITQCQPPMKVFQLMRN